jgi:hypothetical protein
MLLAPAAGFDGETDAVKKHLVVAEQVAVDPAAGAASIATPSMLVAPTAKSRRAMVRTDLRMVATPVCVNGLSVVTVSDRT